jgi:gamma-glutamyl-gamma-aminobutyrate hydrolase PuuD
MILSNKILVPLDISYGNSIIGLGEITDNIASFFKSPKDFKLVLFTGGADISPTLYGETSPKGMCGSDLNRDRIEIRIFKHAISNNVKVAGICRGMQFVNVMAEGRMFHHVSNHAGSIHNIQVANGEVLEVNSLHHQMCILGSDTVLVGWAKPNISEIYYGNRDEQVGFGEKEAEIIIVPNQNACGVQYHPEIMDKKSCGYKFFYKFIEDFLKINMDKFVKDYTSKKELTLYANPN